MLLTQPEAFAITLLIEAPFAASLAFALKLRHWRAALAAATGSALTHPFVWWAQSAFFDAPPYLPEALAETGAVLIETLFYRAFATRDWRLAALLSFTANAASFGLGAFLQS